MNENLDQLGQNQTAFIDTRWPVQFAICSNSSKCDCDTDHCTDFYYFKENKLYNFDELSDPVSAKYDYEWVLALAIILFTFKKSSPNNDTGRNQSVDAFRGLCVLLMIFVNYGGAGIPLFQHAPWHGLTIADLIFPWFIYLMGCSISYQKSKSIVHAFWRMMRMFLIGLFIINKSTCLRRVDQKSERTGKHSTKTRFR